MDKEMYKVMIAEYMRRESILKQEVLDLTMEIAELKDKLNNIGEHAETDGYEVGSPSDYETDPQLNLFDDDKQLKIFESPDGGKTVYERNAGDYENRTEVIKLHDKNS